MPYRYIFRMTYYKNIEQFLRDGAVFAKNHQPMQQCYQTSYKDIVHRRGSAVFQTPCGNVVNDFVPFYFSPITGMAFTIHMENVDLIQPDGITNLGKTSMDDVVFLVCDPNEIQNAKLNFWFTNTACNSMAIEPVYENNLSKLADHVKWALFDEAPLKAIINEIGYNGVCQWFHDRDFGEHRNRSADRMAEFLVQDALPLNLVKCIITNNDNIKKQVEGWMQAFGCDIPVHVKTGCYF